MKSLELKKFESRNILPMNLQFFAEGDEEKKDDQSNTGDKKEEQNTEKTFTQAEVNAISKREKSQGKRSAFSDLGFKDEAEAKTTVSEFTKYKESQKTETQKIADSLAAESQAKIDAVSRATKAEAKVEAMVLGVKPASVDDVITLAMAKMTEGSDFKSVLAEIKVKYPILFTEGGSDDHQDDKNKTGTKGTGGNISGKNNGTDKEQSIGVRLAAQRKGVANKNSFFTK